MRKKANNTSTNNLVDKLINFMLVLNCIETFQIFDSLAVNSQVEMYFFNIFFMIYFKTLKYFNVALLIFLFAVQNITKCKPFPIAFFVTFVASKIIALYTYIYVKILLIACVCYHMILQESNTIRKYLKSACITYQ